MAQLLERLPSTHKVMGSIPSRRFIKAAMIEHACHPSTQEVGAGGPHTAQGHLQLHREIKASLDYMRPCLQNNV